MTRRILSAMNTINKSIKNREEEEKEEKTPIISQLLEITEQQAVIIHLQAGEIQQLKDEIACLKGQKPKPEVSILRSRFRTNAGDNLSLSNGIQN